MKASELKRVTGRVDFIGPEENLVEDITQDSRKAGEHTAFLAREGFNTDGHNFIEDAYRRGCRVFIVEHLPEKTRSDAAYLVVKNPGDKLGRFSCAIHDSPQEDLSILGVTGTNGKTTTCYIIYDMLNSLGCKTGLIGTIKIDVGDEVFEPERTTPEASEIFRYLAAMRDNGCEAAVLEVSSHALALNRVEELEFTSAIFTNISQDHLDFHDDMDDYLDAKLSLFRKLSPEGKGFYNRDDERIAAAFEENFQDFSPAIYSYSFNNTSDFQAENLEVDAEKSEFELCGTEYEFPMPGHFNAYNALSAISLLLELDYEPENVRAALQSFSGVPGRVERVSGGENFTVLVDYAHTPAGIRNVLLSLNRLEVNNIRTVFGCGGDRDRDKRPKMGREALENSDDVIITSDNPRSEDPDDIIDDIVSDINFERYSASWEIIRERSHAIEKAIERAVSGDIVVIFGKGHETYQEFSDRKIDFDDREEARKALQKRGESF